MATNTRYLRCPVDKAANCPFAADRKPRADSEACPFVCGAGKVSMQRTCREDLEEVDMSKGKGWILGLALVAAIGSWFLWPKQPVTQLEPKKQELTKVEPPAPPPIVIPKPEPIVLPKPPAPPPPEPNTTTLLKIAATVPLGEELMLPVVTGYLQHEKLTGIETVKGGSPGSLIVRGHPDGQMDFVAIEIMNSAEELRLEVLADNSADAVVSFRRATPREVTGLRVLGDLASNACEEIIALDGLAVVTHKSNSLGHMTLQQLRSLLRAEVSDWSALGSSPGSVQLHLPRENTAAVDALKAGVGVSIPRLKDDRRYDLPRQMADAVAADPQGLGLVPFRHLRSCKALAIGDEEVKERLLPTPFTLATESYRLCQRIYLHHAAAPKNDQTLRFVSWLVSISGQRVVGDAGFVDLNLTAESRPLPDLLRAALPTQLVNAVKSTEVVDASVFFSTDSFDLDNRAQADLNRIAPFLAETNQRGKQLILFGHADNTGNEDYNLGLSKKRAEAVSSLLQQRGVHPASAVGVGMQMPIASNSTDDGKARNRRVEMWIVELR